MMHDGWCPDCDLPSVVIDVDDQGERAWASCTECSVGWVHREDLPEPRRASRTTERQAA